MLRLTFRFLSLISVSILCFAHINLAHAQTDVSTDTSVAKNRQQEAAALYKESNWLAATGKREQAIASYEAFDAKFGKDDDIAIQTLLVKALINRAAIIGNLNRLGEEVIALDAIILRFDAMQSPQQSPQFAEHLAAAFNNKIYALKRQGKFAEALLVYDQLEARFGQNPASQVRAAVAMGLFNKAEILDDLGKLAISAFVYGEVDKRYGQDDDADIREQVLYALVHRALMFERLNKTTDKVLTYIDIHYRFGSEKSFIEATTDESNIREKIAAAMLHRFHGLKGYEEKIIVAEELQRQFGQDKSVKVMGQVRTAMNSAGYASILRAKEFWANKPLRQHLLESAIDKLQQADYLQVKMKANMSDYWYVNGNLGYALFLSGNPSKAKAFTKATLKMGGEKAFKAQQADAKLFRVEPQDTRYEALLTKLWAK